MDARLAADLVLSMRDALATERGLKLVTSGGDLALAGELRVSAGRVRLRLRVLGPGASIVWSTRIGGRRGPADASLRERWERAMEQLNALDPIVTRGAADALDALHREAPSDPAVMASLAIALVHLWLQTSAVDPSIASRAEELALRALDADPQLADACMAMARLRLVMGDTRGALRGLRETLALAPTYGAAHFFLAGMLCDVGLTEDGLRRYEVAQRLGASGGAYQASYLRSLALAGRGAEVEAAIAAARGTPAIYSLVPMMTETCVWNGDMARAAEAVALMRASPRGGTWEAALPIVEAESRGERGPEVLALARAFFGRALAAPTAPWYRALIAKIGAGHLAYAGADADEVLRMVELVAAQSACLDLAWLDHVPFLAPFRGDTRFASARAVVAARVADLGL